ncbi:MAG: hypothetical protein WAO12_00365 [Venatoribacter sp.]
MSELELSNTRSLLERYYEEEKAQRERELSLAELKVLVDANDLAFLNIIAKRFGKTRNEIAQEVLANALVDLFSGIEAGERKLIARDADEAARNLANAIAEENGLKSLDIKSGVWAAHDRNFTKLERKKVKSSEAENNSLEGLEDAPTQSLAEASDNQAAIA